MESPVRKMLKKNDYNRHKLLRKIKRLRKARKELELHAAENELKKKLKLKQPKFDEGKDDDEIVVTGKQSVKKEYEDYVNSDLYRKRAEATFNSSENLPHPSDNYPDDIDDLSPEDEEFHYNRVQAAPKQWGRRGITRMIDRPVIVHEGQGTSGNSYNNNQIDVYTDSLSGLPVRSAIAHEESHNMYANDDNPDGMSVKQDVINRLLQDLPPYYNPNRYFGTISPEEAEEFSNTVKDVTRAMYGDDSDQILSFPHDYIPSERAAMIHEARQAMKDSGLWDFTDGSLLNEDVLNKYILSNPKDRITNMLLKYDKGEPVDPTSSKYKERMQNLLWLFNNFASNDSEQSTNTYYADKGKDYFGRRNIKMPTFDYGLDPESYSTIENGELVVVGKNRKPKLVLPSIKDMIDDALNPGNIIKDYIKSYINPYLKPIDPIRGFDNGKNPIIYPLLTDKDYDTDVAQQLGYDRGENGHLPSRNYINGDILKHPTHPTFLKALLEDARIGYYPTKDHKKGRSRTATWKGNEKYNFNK